MRRLLVDTMLGRVVAYLRMCGHDTVYALDEGTEADDEVLEYARETGRTVITRDEALAARPESAMLLESRDIFDQLHELRAAGIRLELPDEPTYCGACNGSLTAVAPDDRTPEYAPDPVAEDVWRCPDCGQHFWKGSHWEDVAETLENL
jgi:uncharacterized protein with PIN domain